MRAKVNPTRMELTKLKRQLSVATRGHKLLKDKQDEMVRQFMLLIKQNRELRIEIERELQEINSEFYKARLKMNYQGIMEALMIPSNSAKIKVSSKSIMNINVPTLKYQDEGNIDLTYGFAFTPSELDSSVIRLSKLLNKLILLAKLKNLVIC